MWNGSTLIIEGCWCFILWLIVDYVKDVVTQCDLGQVKIIILHSDLVKNNTVSSTMYAAYVVRLDGSYRVIDDFFLDHVRT